MRVAHKLTPEIKSKMVANTPDEGTSSQTLGNESEFGEITEPKIAHHPLEFGEHRLLNERISTKLSSFQ